MRFLPLVLLLLFVPLAFVRTFDAPEAPPEASPEACPIAPTGPTDDLLEILPRDAVFVLQTDDWDAIRSRAGDNTWVRFFSDERITSVIERIVGAMPSPGEGVPSFDEIQASIHGSVALFLSPARRGGLSGGILIQPEGEETTLVDALKEVASSLRGTSSLSREAYAGHDIIRVETPGEDEVLVGFADKDLIAILFGPNSAAADEIVRQTIDRWDGMGKGGTFATGGLCASADGLDDDPIVSMHLDVQRLADALKPGWRVQPDAVPLRQLGLAEMEWIHAYLDLGADESFEASLAMHVPPTGLFAGLVDGFGELPGDMLKRFPEKSMGVGMMHYDLAGAFATVQDFLKKNQPDAYQDLRAGLQMGGAQLGVDLEEDFVGQFTGNFGSFTTRVPSSEVNPLLSNGPHTEAIAQGAVYFVELEDADPVEQVLDRVLFFAELDPEVEEIPVGNTDIHRITFEDVFTVHWSFVDDGLFLSEHESALRSALKQIDSVVPSNHLEGFRAGLGEAQSASGVSLVETESSVEAMLGMAHAFAAMMTGFGMPQARGLRLPDPSMAEEFFSGTLMFSVERGDDSLGFCFQAR